MEALEVKRRRIWSLGSAHRVSRSFTPPVSEVPLELATLGEHIRAGDWLGGGEPTLRPDFLDVLKQCPAPVSLFTDGLALTDPAVVRTLKRHGVERICIPIFSIRPDAHDWLVGLPGAGRRSLKAIRVCAEAGLQVHVEVIPTRSTAGLLMETVGVLGRLGVHTLWFRRLRIDWLESDDVVALAPRLGLLEPELVSATAAAKRLGLRVQWVGFPSCAIQGSFEERWGEDEWLGTDNAAVGLSSTSPDCGCDAPCDGLPMDYIHRFGWTEFGTGPDTRVDAVVRRVVSGGGLFPRSNTPTEAVRIAFGAPTPDWDPSLCDPIVCEPSRVIRQRMVEASQLGARELVVCNSGVLQHPDAEDLLWEMTRLSFERVRLAGELSALAGCSQRVFRRFKGIHRVDGVWFGPSPETHDQRVGVEGAFEGMTAALRGFQEYAGADVGMYAILRSADELKDYLARFEALGFEPYFRLGDGVDFYSLAQALTGLDEAVQAQVGALLPEAVWTGPRAPLRFGLPPWGPGGSAWTSRIDRDPPP